MFADDSAAKVPNLPEEFWKVLIVDDEPEVHAVTKLALSDFSFLGRGLQFFSAHSGSEAKQLVKDHPDAAIVLLDVVMETDDAGLNVARFIREEAANRFTRIILRTGQPGQAPERTVIVNYDINDYKSKTELTAQKLFTAVMSALRSYRDIMSIDQSRQGLEKIISAATDLYALQSMNSFVDGLVQQLSWVIGGARQTLYASADDDSSHDYRVRAAYGDDAQPAIGQTLRSVIPAEALAEVDTVIKHHSIHYGDDFILAYCRSHCRPRGAILYLQGFSRSLSDDDHHVLQLFAENVQLAHDNVICLEDADRFLATMTDELMGRVSTDYDSFLAQQPVARLADAIAAELAPEQRQDIACAAYLYQQAEDLLTCRDDQPAASMATYQQRVSRSLRALEQGHSSATQLAHRALHERLERWDGMGLPKGKEGEQIALSSQIIMLVQQLHCWLQGWQQGQDSEQGIVARLQAESGQYYAPDVQQHVAGRLAHLRDVI